MRMNKKFVKISALISLMLIFSFFACKVDVDTATQYTVTFNANDGSTSPATAIQVFTEGEAQALTTIESLGFSKSGYTFAGWATSSDATSVAYGDGVSYAATGNVTLYAVWAINAYTVTFNANDGSSSPATATQIFTAGTAQALTTAATLGFSKSGYSFAGWATSSDASSAAYADGESYTATADVNLYAVWTLAQYTVTFNANYDGASPATGSQSFTAGTAQALKTAATLGFSRSGYSFAGWATSSDASSAAYADGESYTATADVTLYAVWTLARYTVTFNANYDGASPATATQTFTAGSAQTLKTAATLGFSRSGYNFAGWARSNTATSAAYTDGASYTATENVTLYAVWTLARYTVTFNANYDGASPATGSQSFTAGSVQALKTAATLGFSRSGYNFVGWATSSDAGSAAYSDGASYTASTNATLYAVWRPRALVRILVTRAPTKILYFADAGESLSTDGMVVTAIYDNGSKATVTGATTSGFDTASAGIKTLTVSYTENGVTTTTETPYYVAASDALTQTVQDNGTTSISGTSFQLVKFGDFPQTIAASGIFYSPSTVYNGWYLGSDGYFYEACSANLFESSYKFSNNVTISSGRTYYFKVQPIEWRVLKTDNEAKTKLLLAEKILTANVPYYKFDNYSNTRIKGGATIYSNNYKYSQIRAYLNGLNYYNDSNTAVTTYNKNGFLQKAFTTSAQALIETTSVDNSAASTNPDGNSTLWNSGRNTYVCDNTSDKIFLLSEEEVTRSAYGFAEYNSSGEGNLRIRVTTDYAKANYACLITTSGYGGYWWLRSPLYDNSDRARYVSGGGNINDYLYVDFCNGGVCPALFIRF